MQTEGWYAAGLGESDVTKFVESQTPLGRLGRPEDIAPAAVFFASSDSSWITGETLLIAGGWGGPTKPGTSLGFSSQHTNDRD